MQGARLNVNTRRHHCVENALRFSNSHGKCTRPLRFDHLGHSSLSSAQARYCAHRRRVVLLNNATKQLVYAATAEDALVVLRKACTLKSVPTDEVIKNLTTVKDDFKRSPRLIKDFPGGLDGSWRLIFAAPSPIPMWAYVPVIEDFAISTKLETVALKSYVGPFIFSFSGTCSFQANEMLFAFDNFSMTAFGFHKGFSLPPKQKKYSFFLLDGDVAAVESGATGGNTLMYRVVPAKVDEVRKY